MTQSTSKAVSADAPHVDLSPLREMTGTDAALETELFEAFYEGAIACIAGLEGATAPEDAQTWRKHAHALKGISRNLGAMPLGELAFEAQEKCEAGADEKVRMLAGIKAEYALVEAYLRGVHP
ncbi:MAG: Hpt domain-containing protein [Rhodospirillales bacterium]|nr:Hpt domain-containing protein [Alphaproteobacteria bacterium]MCB9987373.1 Hpt domain-containing protein [Rhodospirillales bacterium]USO07779.1 MAG: Hpt domain-containing protein [Rhodospirillales bacterium]